MRILLAGVVAAPSPRPPRRRRSPRAGTRRPPACRSRSARRGSTAARSTRSRGRRPSPPSAPSSGSTGCRVTGLADARTRKALGPLGRPLFGARTLRRGAFGWDVAVLQFLLVRQGISVPVNAYFDGPTLHGVRAHAAAPPPASRRRRRAAHVRRARRGASRCRSRAASRSSVHDRLTTSSTAPAPRA